MGNSSSSSSSAKARIGEAMAHLQMKTVSNANPNPNRNPNPNQAIVGMMTQATSNPPLPPPRKKNSFSVASSSSNPNSQNSSPGDTKEKEKYEGGMQPIEIESPSFASSSSSLLSSSSSLTSPLLLSSSLTSPSPSSSSSRHIHRSLDYHTVAGVTRDSIPVPSLALTLTHPSASGLDCLLAGGSIGISSSRHTEVLICRIVILSYKQSLTGEFVEGEYLTLDIYRDFLEGTRRTIFGERFPGSVEKSVFRYDVKANTLEYWPSYIFFIGRWKKGTFS